jgi:hypothetical protein
LECVKAKVRPRTKNLATRSSDDEREYGNRDNHQASAERAAEESRSGAEGEPTQYGQPFEHVEPPHRSRRASLLTKMQYLNRIYAGAKWSDIDYDAGTITIALNRVQVAPLHLSAGK